jgi:hypothetical protein
LSAPDVEREYVNVHRRDVAESITAKQVENKEGDQAFIDAPPEALDKPDGC